jgi:isopenicillin-N epimerase
VTSPTALVLPIAEIVKVCAERGVDVLVDGAHGPGMLELKLDAIGAAYYTGNLHKWPCAPKGAAFLHVRRDEQDALVPVVTSHGRNDTRTHKPRFQLEMDWTGTHDPTPYLCVPATLRTMASMVPGGWAEVRARNAALARRARDVVATALGVEAPAPEAMLGSMASLILPRRSAPTPASPFDLDPLQRALFETHAIEVPIMPWPALGTRLVRVSAQLYDSEAEYTYLGDALRAELA